MESESDTIEVGRYWRCVVACDQSEITREIRKPSRGAGSAFDSSLGEAVASNKRVNVDA